MGHEEDIAANFKFEFEASDWCLRVKEEEAKRKRTLSFVLLTGVVKNGGVAQDISKKCSNENEESQHRQLRRNSAERTRTNTRRSAKVGGA